MAAGQDTLSEHDGDHQEAGAVGAGGMALVVVWCRDEPWRIGQSLELPAVAADARTFGRGPSEPGDRARISLQEHRPGVPGHAAPLVNPAISRTQLEIRTTAWDRLLIRNVGRCGLMVNGSPVSDATEITVDDLIALGRQMLLLAVSRPAGAPSVPLDYPEFGFGQPDAFGLVGESPAMWRVREQIGAVAARTGHVLVLGASGTGKELVARALHALSPRRARPLVARNAATLPDSLIDAELFGNLRNYPNPGTPERPGLVGAADGSTLFLDEIAELPPAGQAHLLRLLDGGEYHRLGEATPRRADIRVIAATNRPVSALKPDLAARFIFRVDIPALSARRQDIPLLVRHIVRQAASRGDRLAASLLPRDLPPAEPAVEAALAAELLGRDYPLNVRELESTLWHAITAGRPPAAGADGRASRATTSELASVTAGAADLSAPGVQRCLDDNNGVIETTWRALGLKNRFVLLRLIKKHGLEVRRRPGQPRGPRLG